MMHSIFPINLYKTSIDVDWNRGQVIDRLNEYFDKQIVTGEIVRTLHKEPLFGPIVKFMDQTVAQYWKELQYHELYPITICSMWANKMIGDHQFPYPLENHSPAIISVVFYVNKDLDMGNIYFANPLEHMWQTQPLSSTRRYDKSICEVETITGDLLCFPSWINHGVRPNTTNKERLVVAADYELKGLSAIKKITSMGSL
jgi:uncharacterized protein (TIGR02466 family)